MKIYQCVKVDHHDKIAKTIEEWQKKGWRLHTYQVAGLSGYNLVNHYLLFESGE